MRLPSAAAWIFSAKTCAAAIAALYLAFALDLDRPSWAIVTVFIASQPFAGATQSKSVYRFIGTIIGAVATIVMVPTLVETPALLSLALAAWVAGCLWLSLQDRSPRSYIFMLAGYTCAFVGFPAVNAPENIFLTGVARVEEITLGIVCSSVIHCVVLPNKVRDTILRRVDSWMADARRWTLQTLSTKPVEGIGTMAFQRMLAAYPIEVDLLSHHLEFEKVLSDGDILRIKELQRRLTMVLPLVASVEERLALLLERGYSAPARVETLLDSVRAWLSTGALPLTSGDLRREIKDIEKSFDDAPAWEAILWASLLQRLRALIDTINACQRLRHDIAQNKVDSRNGRPFFSHREERHIDQGTAFLSAATAFIAILAGCAIWILTGWADGSFVPMLAAVSCSFFATMDNPLPAMKGFLKFALAAAAISLLYTTILLPRAGNFETLVIMLVPLLLWIGILLATPKTMFIGMTLAANMLTLVGLNNRFSSDFGATINSTFSLTFGLILTGVTMSIIRARTPQWSALRIVRAGRADVLSTVNQASNGRRLRLSREAFVYRMLDRLHVLTPRLTAMANSAEQPSDLLPELSLGLNLMNLHIERPHVSPDLREHLDRMMEAILSYLSRQLDDADAPISPALCEQLDLTMQESARARSDPGPRKNILIALTNVRLLLFPQAPFPSLPARL